MWIGENLQLSYCTNIHPSHGWEEVKSNVLDYGIDLRSRLTGGKDFGIGLRLSGTESSEILEGNRLSEFKSLLDDSGLYVFTMNAFPHGTFHRSRVKDHVHTPDWRTQERVDYTIRCIDVLAELLPEGIEGGISTNPLSYKPWFKEGIKDDEWIVFTTKLIEVVRYLVLLEKEKGVWIHIDIEPEPDGVFGSSRDLVTYYKEHLLLFGAQLLSKEYSCSIEDAELLIRRHLQVCWDTCHVAVEYEKAESVLDSYESLGIEVGKVQISSALKVDLPNDVDGRQDLKKSLSRFEESTYLHQVVQRNVDGSHTSFSDLDIALEKINDLTAAEWRIHFHVPIFAESLGDFGSTQDSIVEALELNRLKAFTRHLEIETYTWDVLPDYLKIPMLDSIEREYLWVLKELGNG